jgi:hypothetical protein
VQITRSSVSTVSISERAKALAERDLACGDVCCYWAISGSKTEGAKSAFDGIDIQRAHLKKRQL